MTDIQLFPLELSLPFEGAPITLSTAKELADWARRQMELWEITWNGVKESLSPYAQHCKNRLIIEPRLLFEIAEKIDEAPNQNASLVNSARTHIALYERGENIAAESNLGTFITGLLQKHQLNDVVAAMYVSTRMIDDSNLYPISGTPNDETIGLREHGEKVLKTFGPLVERPEVIKGLDTRIAKLRSEVNETETRLNSLDARLLAKNTALETEDLVTFWKDRAKEYGRSRNLHMVGFLLTAIVAVVYYLRFEGPATALIIAAVTNPNHQTAADAGSTADPSMITGAPIVGIFGLVLVGVIFVWVMRTWLRLFYAARELCEDAKERAVLMKTLLSAGRNDSIPVELRGNLWSKAWDVLFRPVGTHSITDDGPGGWVPWNDVRNFIKGEK